MRTSGSWAAIAAFASLLLAGATGAAPAGSDHDAVLATLRQRFPEATIERVGASPWAGILEVYTPNELFYSSPDGERIFVGKMIETRTRTDLTAKAWNETLRIQFSDLPFDKAIKIVKGNGSRKLAVFEDPRCPYCQQLEATLAGVTDITEYVFLYPLEELHPGATVTSRRIWCSTDRAAAWVQWMQTKVEPGSDACEQTPIAELAKLGDRMKIESTPTIFLSDGSRIPGAVDKDVLEARLGATPPPG